MAVKHAVKYLHGPKSKIDDVLAQGKADADDIIIAESGEGTNFITEIYYVQHYVEDDQDKLKAVPLRSLESEKIVSENLPQDEEGNVINVADYVKEQLKIKEY